jgi:F0F1-type ATP synthase assembly protein I
MTDSAPATALIAAAISGFIMGVLAWWLLDSLFG